MTRTATSATAQGLAAADPPATATDLLRKVADDRELLADVCREQGWGDDMLERMDFAILVALESHRDDDPRVAAGEATNEIVRQFFGLSKAQGEQGTVPRAQEGTA